MVNYKVGYFVGSLFSTSINRMLAGALVKLAPAASRRSRSGTPRSTAPTGFIVSVLTVLPRDA